MTFAEPANAAAEAFNSLIRTNPADQEAIGRTEWNARAAWRRNRNPDFGVVLLQALALRGEAKDATQLALDLLPRARHLEPQVRQSLISCLWDLALYDEAEAALLDWWDFAPELARQELSTCLSSAALFRGDIDGAIEIEERLSDEPSNLRTLRTGLGEIGLLSVFPEHIRAVAGIARGFQTRGAHSWLREDGGPIEYSYLCFGSAENAVRREAATKLERILTGIYLRHGMRAHEYAPYLSVTFLPISSHWPLNERPEK